MDILTAKQIYRECINMHSLNWLKNHQDLNTIEYIEFHCGAAMTGFINSKGIEVVVADLNQKITEIIK
jgi:hypothetical protein